MDRMTRSGGIPYLEAVQDDAAQVLRMRVAEEVSQRLAENGLRLSIHHQIGGAVAGVGFATLTEMAAELAEGAARLYRAKLWYAGAALVRQLLECGYLLALAGDNPEEAEAWFAASPTEVRTRFMPKHTRPRATKTFRDSEYYSHCDHGGHPNPAARTLLRGHDYLSPVPAESQWADLALHMAETWEAFCAALPHYDPRLIPGDDLYSPDRAPDGRTEIAQLLDEWRSVDALSSRIPPPQGATA